MRKNVLFLVVTIMFCGCLVTKGEEGSDNKKPNLDSLPAYLKQKRETQREFVEAFIKQVSGDEGAIDVVEKYCVEEVQNNAYQRVLETCEFPGTNRFLIWINSWLTWQKEPRSKLEVELRKIDNWEIDKKKEIYSVAMKYRKKAKETNDLTEEACKKLKKTYREENAILKEIARKTETGYKLLPEPNKKYLHKKDDRFEKEILPKMTKLFHNHKIPVTPEEVTLILSANQLFLQQRVQLREIQDAINSIVEQHEKKMASVNHDDNSGEACSGS